MNNWIPVTERLPDDGQECWTFQPVNEQWYRFEKRVSLHTFFVNYGQLKAPSWQQLEAHAGNMMLKRYLDHQEKDPVFLITHWRPFKRPEPPVDQLKEMP